MQSQSTKELASALAQAQAEFPTITFDAEVEVKTKNGGKYTFKYATLAHIRSIVTPVLAKHGLSISQTFDGAMIVTTLLHSSGEWISSACPMLPDFRIDVDNAGKQYSYYLTQQEWGSEVTYRRRYMLSAILGIAAESDDDGNIGSGNSFKDTGRGAASPAPTTRVHDDTTSRPTPASSSPAPAEKKEKPKKPAEVKTEYDVITGGLAKVHVREGTNKNGKPYTMFTIELDDGKKFSTFDKKIGEAAESLQGEVVNITWKPNGKFRDCLGISPNNKEEDNLDMGEQDGGENAPF